MKYTLLFLDTETTGNTPTDRLCQLCYRTWINGTLSSELNELYLPPREISIGSMAIHHITPKMVADKPGFQESSQYPEIKSLLESPNSIMIAHNAPFDAAVMALEGIFPPNLIDTLKLVRHSDPDMAIERHNLQFLRYYWMLDDNLPPGTVINPHDALSDVIILEQIFWHLFKVLKDTNKFTDDDAILEYMIKRSAEPATIGTFTFGKHMGKRVVDVAQTDPSYLNWLLGQKREQAANGENEDDWIYTLERALGITR